MAKDNSKKSKSSTKTSTKASKAQGKAALAVGAGADTSAFDDVGLDEVGGPDIFAEDRQLLGKVGRFLYTVLAPKLLRRAVGVGYTRQEHDELWALFSTAAGRQRSLDANFRAAGSDDNGQRQQLLVALDSFENTWFPRTRVVIERRVPEAYAERFMAAFFRDLSQQPLGPLVVDSVATFLDRFDALESSSEPGASEVYTTLQSRGLDAELVADLRGKIRRARAGQPSSNAVTDVEQAQRDTQAQQRALRELRLAWNDWGTTLRPLFDVREQVQLGLTDLKVRAVTTTPEAPPAA